MWHKETFQKAKNLIAELAPPYAQSVWRFRGERVRVIGLVVYCNYLLKKKKLVEGEWFGEESFTHIYT